MYNRYIPQPDGSYRRNRMEEAHQNSQPQRKPEPQRKQEPPRTPPCPLPPEPECEKHPPENRMHQGQNVPGFLKQLLPKDFDTADLIIVLLLILLAGDSDEDKSTAMLTLVLYLFL